MPQMNPMNWLLILILCLFSILLMKSLIFYNYKFSIYKKKLNYNSIKNKYFLYKW